MPLDHFYLSYPLHFSKLLLRRLDQALLLYLHLTAPNHTIPFLNRQHSDSRNNGLLWDPIECISNITRLQAHIVLLNL